MTLHRRSVPRWVAGIAILAAMPLAPALAADDIGRPAPKLLVKQLDGRDLDLAALRGKVVVLNFWATWCGPCRLEMPAIDAFSRVYKDRGVEVIGLSADDPHDRKDVIRATQGLSYPMALLSEAKDNGFAAPRALPITYVVGPDGVLRAKFLPSKTGVTEQDLVAAVTPLLP